MLIFYRTATRPSIPWKKKLNPLWLLFGNEDDGIYGNKNFNPTGAQTWAIAIRWWIRNPFHNFMFYGIGIADQTRVWFSSDETVLFFSRGGGWLFGWTKAAGGLIWRPFISYKAGAWEFYIGWRPTGAFGIALRRSND